MPLVFVTDAPTLWESDYADIVGVQYEFPSRYRGLVSSGEPFLYYRGARGAAQGGSGYFGSGVVGALRPGTKPDSLMAEVHDAELFAEVVPIRDSGGNYFETGSTTGTNWANGVRRIPGEAYESIRAAAQQVEPPRPGPAFADPAHASAMERYSVGVVMELLRAEFGVQAVREMPVNNPGYDIEVSTASGLVHVEVKGTVLPMPTFHISEGQRSHGELLGEQWRIYVVYAIDRGRGTHELVRCDGRQLATWGNLQTESWSGVLRDPDL